jgi:rhodanese-related sulfurtransferase
MRTLRAKDLKAMMDRNEKFTLINVLDKDAFEREHIPGSHNIPMGRDDFVDRARELVGSTSGTVVVYCSSADCTASPKAGRKLVEAGFENVSHFEGGMADWKKAGYEVESGEPATR